MASRFTSAIGANWGKASTPNPAAEERAVRRVPQGAPGLSLEQRADLAPSEMPDPKGYAAVEPSSLDVSRFKSLSRNNQATPSEDFGFCPVTRFSSMLT